MRSRPGPSMSCCSEDRAIGHPQLGYTGHGGGIHFLDNARYDDPGDMVFRHACAMGLEGIVSKRLASRYRSGRSPDWLKFKTRRRRG
jgi:hypothetical protein